MDRWKLAVAGLLSVAFCATVALGQSRGTGGCQEGGDCRSATANISTAANLRSVDAGIITTTGVRNSGNGTIAGTLDVTGISNLANIDAGTVMVTGLIQDGRSEAFQPVPMVRHSWEVYTLIGSTTLLFVGTNQGHTVTGSASNANLTTDGFVGTLYTSGTTSGNTTGFCFTGHAVRPNHGMRYQARVKTSADLTNQRVWIGFSEATPAALSVTAGPTAASNNNFFLIGYEVANQSTWECCAGDRTNYSCTAIPSATVVASTGYEVDVDASDAASLICRVRKLGSSAPPASTTANRFSVTAAANVTFANTTTSLLTNLCMTTTANEAHAFTFTEQADRRSRCP